MDYQSIGKTIYDILNGVGHMWFLPMLFWCFMMGYGLYQIKMEDKLKMLLLLALAMVSFAPLPLRIGSAFYYMFFFYGGILLYKNREKLRARITVKSTAVCWLVFGAVFVVLHLTNRALSQIEPGTVYLKVMRADAVTLSRMAYATLGTLALYGTAVMYTEKHRLPRWYMDLGACCFGIYLFQQFVLQWIYYRTPMFSNVYAAPWMGFVIAIALSFALTWLCRKTKVGRAVM